MTPLGILCQNDCVEADFQACAKAICTVLAYFGISCCFLLCIAVLNESRQVKRKNEEATLY